MESVYQYVHDTFGHNDFLTYVIGGSLVVNFNYYLFNLFFITIDMLDPAWVQPYKIQEEKKVSFSKYIGAFKVILFNQIIVGPTVSIFWYFLSKYFGMSFSSQMPTGWEIFKVFIVSIVCEEIGFYYTHRMFHHPRIYKYIHKKHHEWTAPVSVTSIYCHPLEHAISNLSPVLLGPTLCGCHVVSLWLWASFAVFSTTCSHSGYHFPFMLSPEPHDYHHKVFNECFGLGLLDWFHGTDTNFRKSAEFKRSYLSLVLKPIKQIHPDEKKEE